MINRRVCMLSPVIRLKTYKVRFSLKLVDDGGQSNGINKNYENDNSHARATAEDRRKPSSKLRKILLQRLKREEKWVKRKDSRRRCWGRVDPPPDSGTVPDNAHSPTSRAENREAAMTDNVNRNPRLGLSTNNLLRRPTATSLFRHSTLPSIDRPPPSDWLTVETEIVSLNVVNASHLATDLLFCSPAKIDDGVADVVVIRRGISRGDIIKALSADVCKHVNQTCIDSTVMTRHYKSGLGSQGCVSAVSVTVPPIL